MHQDIIKISKTILVMTIGVEIEILKRDIQEKGISDSKIRLLEEEGTMMMFLVEIAEKVEMRISRANLEERGNKEPQYWGSF